MRRPSPAVTSTGAAAKPGLVRRKQCGRLAGHPQRDRHGRRHGRVGAPRTGSRRTGRWHGRLVVIAVVLAALSANVAGRGHGREVRPRSPAHLGGHSPAAFAAADIRGLAARWVTGQVSRSAIVACDPAMCAALQARGMPGGNMLVLRQGAPDPLGADVVVATSALRNQFGPRLSAVYAPDVIASFGSGSPRIEIRAVAADGSAAYRGALGADVLARKAAGTQLLRNAGIAASATASRQLADGAPDSRLLLTLAALATSQPVYVVAFGDSAHGASAGLPLRSVIVTAGGGAAGRDGGAAGRGGGAAGTGGAGYQRGILAFLRAQRPPYLAAGARVTSLTSGQPAVRIEFAAPSPLGLLGTTP